MYCTKNVKTKAELKRAVAAGEQLGVYQVGPFGDSSETQNGRAYVEGPWYPQPHRFYAEVQLKDGVIVKVK